MKLNRVKELNRDKNCSSTRLKILRLFLKAIMKQSDKRLSVLFDVFENINVREKRNIIENCEAILSKILRHF